MSGRRRLRGAFLGVCAVPLLFAGCAEVPIDLRHITIRSDPPGAEVLANDKAIGVTPLAIVPDHDFPPAMDWNTLQYRAMGTLTVRKAGCRPFSEQVNDGVLSKDIMVRLDCAASSAATKPPAAPKSRAADRSPAAARPAAGRHGIVPAPTLSVAQRLRRLERLRKDGLITAKEYHEIRARILNGL